MAGNTLLDFVTALVHDPVAAAEFWADPQQAIDDADLEGVTVADIQDLIPMVSEAGQDGSGLPNPDRGIWSGGDVVQSFDAFDPFDAGNLESEPVGRDVATLDHLDSMHLIPARDPFAADDNSLFDDVPDASFTAPGSPAPEPFAGFTQPDLDGHFTGAEAVAVNGGESVPEPGYPQTEPGGDGTGDVIDWGVGDGFDPFPQ